MSKFLPLWQYIKDNHDQDFQLSFNQIQKIVGLPIDHSFLNYKKNELKKLIESNGGTFAYGKTIDCTTYLNFNNLKN